MTLQDRKRQFDIFRKGSRTYFYSSLFFPQKIRQDVFTVYAFVRTADDFVDSIPQNRSAFHSFFQNYTLAHAGKKVDDPVITNFIIIEKKYHFPPQWTTAFFRAMQADLVKKTYLNDEEINEYMHGSAEVIGLMMARIIGVAPHHYSAAAGLGKSMQMINFLRDVAEDIRFGRQYLPQTLLQTHGLQSLQYGEVKKKRTDFIRCVREYIESYRVWSRVGQEGFSAIPLRYRIPIQTATALYEWTAREIMRDPFRIYREKIKPSVPRILVTLCYFAAGALIQRLQLTLLISRPRFWMYLLGPFLLGMIGGVSSLQELYTLELFAGFLFFSLPANFFLYGVNDLFDQDTDQHNEKKTGYEHMFSTHEQSLIILGLLLSSFFVLFFFISPISVLTKVSLLFFLILGAAYSTPPLRLKARPFADSLSNILYIMPAIFAYSMIAGSLPPLWTIFAGWLWTAAMHTYSAIPDISADTTAKLRTTAVLLGQHGALIYCGVLWCIAALLTTYHTQGHLLTLPLYLYVLFPLVNLINLVSPAKFYRFFPLINTMIGAHLFWSLATARLLGTVL